MLLLNDVFRNTWGERSQPEQAAAPDSEFWADAIQTVKNTFPDFPAEIRAPAGTVAGVSGFQVHFGSKEIFTPGDQYDVLVAMNSAALKVDLPKVKKGGIIIVNTSGFDARNLRLAKYPEGVNPLDDNTLDNYIVYKIDISKHTKDALAGMGLTTKDGVDLNTVEWAHH